MSNGHEHNRQIAWLRFWGALGAAIVADRVYRHTPSADIAREMARYAARRFETACYAMGTTETL